MGGDEEYMSEESYEVGSLDWHLFKTAELLALEEPEYALQSYYTSLLLRLVSRGFTHEKILGAQDEVKKLFVDAWTEEAVEETKH